MEVFVKSCNPVLKFVRLEIDHPMLYLLLVLLCNSSYIVFLLSLHRTRRRKLLPLVYSIRWMLKAKTEACCQVRVSSPLAVVVFLLCWLRTELNLRWVRDRSSFYSFQRERLDTHIQENGGMPV